MPFTIFCLTPNTGRCLLLRVNETSYVEVLDAIVSLCGSQPTYQLRDVGVGEQQPYNANWLGENLSLHVVLTHEQVAPSSYVNLHQRMRGPASIHDAFFGLANVMVRAPGLLATAEEERNPPLFGSGGDRASLCTSDDFNDWSSLYLRQWDGGEDEAVHFNVGGDHAIMGGSAHLPPQLSQYAGCSKALSVSSIQLILDSFVCEWWSNCFCSQISQSSGICAPKCSSEFMMSSNDNLSENGISVCKNIYGIDSCDGLKIMLSTCPMLIRGLRSPGYGCDELLAPAPMAITYGNGVCHLFVGALGSSDSILGRGVFQYTRSGMSFQNEFELQETLGSLPGLSSSILPYYLMNSDFIPLLNGKSACCWWFFIGGWIVRSVSYANRPLRDHISISLSIQWSSEWLWNSSTGDEINCNVQVIAFGCTHRDRNFITMACSWLSRWSLRTGWWSVWVVCCR